MKEIHHDQERRQEARTEEGARQEADEGALLTAALAASTAAGAHHPGRVFMTIEHRTSLERLLAERPPRRPRCFDDDATWHDFLLLADESGERVVRRQDTGKHSGQRKVIPVFAEGLRKLPCSDCELAHRERMVAVGRCERVSPGNAARRWLKVFLILNGPMLASEVRRIAQDNGFPRETIRRVANRLRVRRTRTDPSDPATSHWSLS